MEFWDPIDGEQFGQEERLTVRLRGLVRAYPRSVGIVKEFLQNADDAGATWLRVIWDEREHPREQLPDPRMAILQGPALLFVSDQVFTEADFAAIRRIGESSKSELGPKTGKFGLGFNTAYNVTDFPGFVSGRWAVVFDPHRRCVDADGEGTGRRWELADLWHFAPDFAQSFVAGGLVAGAREHAHTIFRLPVRDAEQARASEICDEPFERGHFDEMLRDLAESGDELLLFARNLLDIRVERIDAGGVRHELLRITTLDRDDVIVHRAIGNAAVEGDIRDNLARWRIHADELPRTAYRHTFEVVSPKQTELRPWQIAAGLFVDEVGELLRRAEAMAGLRERALPWAGAAIRLELRDATCAVVAAQRGKLCCTFPLAEQPGSLPCHLNACFDLDASRRQLSLDAAVYAEADRVRVAWNHALLRHALPQAAALAIAALAPEVAEAGPGRFYGLWPDLQRGEEPWRGFAQALLVRLSALPLVRTRAGRDIAWQALEDTPLPPTLWGPDLQEALRDDGLRLPDPDVSPRLVRSVEAAGASTRRYRPAELRTWLRTDAPLGVPLAEAPRACLRERSYIVDLLQFCLSDRTGDIDGLPLALTCDGMVRTFGRAGELLLADDAIRPIFADRGAWFIEPGVQAHTRLQPCASAGLHVMTPDRVVARLAERLSVQPGDTIAWDPGGDRPPNAAWLLLVLRWLAARVPAELAAPIAGFALYPDAHGRLRSAAGGGLLIPTDDLDRALRGAIAPIGVELVTGGHDLIDAIRALQQKHPGPIAALTGPSLALRLPAVREGLAALPADARERAALLDYLAAPRWLDHYGPDALAALRDAPLLRTRDDRVVAADAPQVYLPGEFRPPALVDVAVDLVDDGPGGRWRPLLARLGVPEMRAGVYIAAVLVPNFAALDPGLQRAALLWLRDEVDLRALERDDPALVELLRDTPLIRARDGQLRPAAQLHTAGDAAVAGPARGRQAWTPDMAFYRGDRARWQALFAWLGVRDDPRPEALLEDVDTFLAELATDREGALRGLAEVFALLHARWSDLPGRDALAAGLRARAWLPAVLAAPVAGFVAPDDRLYRADELYIADSLELIASQGPVLAAAPPDHDPELGAALGLRTPTTEAIVAHLDHLRRLWDAADHGGLDPVALGCACAAIYAALGRPDRAVSEDILRGLAARPCVWDGALLRFWRPAHVFLTPVADLFGDLRGHVPGDSDEVRRGLLRLGCRPRPEVGDIVAALQAIGADHDDGPLSAAALALVLRLLRRVLDLEATDDALAELPVPTRAGRLRRAADVRVDDAPWLSSRIADDAVPFLHPRVGAELIERLGLARLSAITDEALAERPALSGNLDKQQFCRQLMDTIHHPAFAAGVARILAHQGARPGAGLALLSDLRVVATDRLVTHLRVAGVARPLGAEEVAVFADADRRVVFVSGDHWDSVVVQIGEAINRLLDSALRDLAHLEAILRTRPDDIVALLDHRRVPRLPGDATGPDLAGPDLAAPDLAAPDLAAPDLAAPDLAAATPATPRSIMHERTAAVEAAGGAAAQPADPDLVALAIARVVAFEREAGRDPRTTDSRHPAYDVQSGPLGDPNTRFIRVVALDGPWDRIDVVLGATHYSAGRAFGRNFWLYVVEHALDPVRARIHRIHDPVSRVARFAFGPRWIAQGERNAVEMAPYVGWTHRSPGGPPGVIESVEAAGTFIWLNVRLDDGRHERRFFKPALDHVSDERAPAEHA